VLLDSTNPFNSKSIKSLIFDFRKQKPDISVKVCPVSFFVVSAWKAANYSSIVMPGSAKLLVISCSLLYAKIKKYGIQ